MKQKILTTLFGTTMLLTLFSGCENSNSTAVSNEIATTEEISEVLEEIPTSTEESEPEIIVIETDFGSYTRLGENVDYPEELENIEIDINNTLIQLSLPKDMGASFHFDSDTNSLFIFNEDKSKMGFLYFTDFLQTEAYKIAYDTETFSNTIAFDSFITTAGEATTLKQDDTLIVQHIPAVLKEYTENEHIQNAYTGKLLRYQTYNTDTVELPNDDGTISKAYTGNKIVFYYGEDIVSDYLDYIVESFTISEDIADKNTIIEPDADINNVLIENTNLANEEFVLQTSYLHSIAPMSEDAQWQSYINLGLHRTQITDDMTLEEIQEAIKKSHVYLTTRRSTGTPSSHGGFGSGFVIDIDEDTMYIATNQHCVVGNDAKGKKNGFYIRFSDTYNELNVLMDTYDINTIFVGETYSPDFAILKCDISSIPYEDRQLFKAIPKIEDIELTQGMPVYMYHMPRGSDAILKTGSLYSTEKIAGYDGKTMCYYTTAIGISGDSGSLFFTQNGQCLGIVASRMTLNNNSTYYNSVIPYDLIPTTFEKIVGRPLYNEISLKEFFTQFMYDYWEEITPNSIVSSDTILPEETSENTDTTQ